MISNWTKQKNWSGRELVSYSTSTECISENGYVKVERKLTKIQELTETNLQDHTYRDWCDLEYLLTCKRHISTAVSFEQQWQYWQAAWTNISCICLEWHSNPVWQCFMPRHRNHWSLDQLAAFQGRVESFRESRAKREWHSEPLGVMGERPFSGRVRTLARLKGFKSATWWTKDLSEDRRRLVIVVGSAMCPLRVNLRMPENVDLNWLSIASK